MSNEGNQYRVRLQESSNRRRLVSFNVTPDLTESRNVSYKTVEPVHMPGQFYVYTNTSARTFSLTSIKFISRTRKEAQTTLEQIQLIRSWTMPRFGNSSTLGSEHRTNRNEYAQQARTPGQSEGERMRNWEEANDKSLGRELLGSPPPVLLLSAYTRSSDNGLGHIRKVPVIVTQLNITYPSDVTYIPSSVNNQPVPTIMSIDLQLGESHSPSEYSRFSLDHFRNGTLPGF